MSPPDHGWGRAVNLHRSRSSPAPAWSAGAPSAAGSGRTTPPPRPRTPRRSRPLEDARTGSPASGRTSADATSAGGAMTFAVLLGALCTLMAAALVAPSWDRYVPRLGTGDSTESSRALLRRLRDLDDDLAAGRILEDDHHRLRSDLERQAADALGRDDSSAVRSPDRWPSGAAEARRPGRPALAPARRGHRGRRPCRCRGSPQSSAGPSTSGLRRPRQPAAQRRRRPPGSHSTRTRSPRSRRPWSRWKRHPGQAAAHVELARAYTAPAATAGGGGVPGGDPPRPRGPGGQHRPGHGRLPGRERRAGRRPAQPHPPRASGYPEALYTRGLVRAMGLSPAAAAATDPPEPRHGGSAGSAARVVTTVLALARQPGPSSERAGVRLRPGLPRAAEPSRIALLHPRRTGRSVAGSP